MLLDAEFCCDVVLPRKSLEKGPAYKGLIANRLLYILSTLIATEKCGYFLAVTKVKRIGRGKPCESSACIIFPVNFCCRTLIPKNNEIMIGAVHQVSRRGVFLKCGPMQHVFLSIRLMPRYQYIETEKTPFFLGNDLSRIDMDVVIRFVVFAVRWKEDRNRQFWVLASIDGDSLGPISLAGTDGIEY